MNKIYNKIVIFSTDPTSDLIKSILLREDTTQEKNCGHIIKEIIPLHTPLLF